MEKCLKGKKALFFLAAIAVAIGFLTQVITVEFTLQNNNKMDGTASLYYQYLPRTQFSEEHVSTCEFNDNVNYNQNNSFNEDIFSFYQSKCSEEEYFILIHHVIYNETFKEIARDKKASINSIKSTYRRLIKKLKGEHYEKNK